jgi:RNA polymerase sigma-70 factor, ECF subfamily
MNDARPMRSAGSGSRSSGTSHSLLERVRADDAEAWDRLVTLYAPLVAHWCGRWRLPPDDTADVFQEVFQSVATHIGGFRNDRDSDTFRGWLRTITRSKVFDHFRKQGHEPRAVGGSEAQQRLSRYPAPAPEGIASETGPGPGDELPATDDAAAEGWLFRRGLDLIRAEFEPRTWQAFWQTAVEGRSAADVGNDLAMSPGAVRVAKSRVLQRLRAELGDLSERPPRTGDN